MSVWDRNFRPLWPETSRESAPVCPPLQGETTADVVVIGAGYAGLSTAIHLADAGAKVVVLEAEAPGFGGSGRNGGQVIAGLRHIRSEVVEHYGVERGEALYAFGQGTAQAVWELIDRFQIQADDNRRGWINAAHGQASLDQSRRRVEALTKLGAPVDLLDRDRIVALTGTEEYLGGWIDRRAGSVQPLGYARGLARGALLQGAAIHCDSRVVALKPVAGGWICCTARGTVRAKQVVVATTGYSDRLVPGLKSSVILVQSFQIATAPLSTTDRLKILPEGQCVSDTRNLLRYFRVDRDHRLIVGGRGGLGPARGPEAFGLQRLMLAKLYPHLAATPTPHHWGGWVAVSPPGRWPKLHEPAPGLLVTMGCNGKGVAWNSAIGRMLADRCLGRPIAMPIEPIRRIPFPWLRKLYTRAATVYYRWQDSRA